MLNYIILGDTMLEVGKFCVNDDSGEDISSQHVQHKLTIALIIYDCGEKIILQVRTHPSLLCTTRQLNIFSLNQHTLIPHRFSHKICSCNICMYGHELCLT